MVHKVLTTMAKLQHHPLEVRMGYCMWKMNSWHGSEVADQIRSQVHIHKGMHRNSFQAKIHWSACISCCKPTYGFLDQQWWRTYLRTSKIFAESRKWAKLYFFGCTTVQFPQSLAFSVHLQTHVSLMGQTNNRIYMRDWAPFSWSGTINKILQSKE